MLKENFIRLKRLNNHSMSLVITIIALSLAVIPLFFPPKALTPLPTYLFEFSNFNTFYQKLSLQIFLITLALLALASPWLQTLFSYVFGARAISFIGALSSSFLRLPVLFIFLFFPIILWLYPDGGMNQYTLGSISFLILFFFCGNQTNNRTVKAIFILLSTLMFIYFLVLGFFWSQSFVPGINHDFMCVHYYSLFGLTPLLVNGSELFANIQYNYGIFIQTFLAILQKHFFSFQLGDYVLIVQISQIFFTFLSLLCYWLFARRNTYKIIFCLALWIPWVTTSGLSIAYPTQSCLRFMNFPIAIIAMLFLLHARRYCQSIILGIISGATLLYNFETGICITITFLAFVLVSENIITLGRILTRFALFIFGCMLFILFYVMLFRIGLGNWPRVSLENFLYFFNLFLSGFGGLPLRFDPLAVIIVLYPSYILVRLTRVWLTRKLSDQMKMKFSISFLLLIWLPYYFNRVDPWNLWTYIYLLSFIILDQIPTPQNILDNRIGLKKLINKKVPGIVFLIIYILGPSLANKGIVEFTNNWDAFQYRYSLQKDSQKSKKISGILYTSQVADEIIMKTNYLEDRAKSNKVFFLCSSQFLLQIETGIYFPLPTQDLFIESVSTSSLERNIAALKSWNPDVILLDDMLGCVEHISERKLFNDYLGNTLNAEYKQIGNSNGWIILMRNYHELIPK